MVRVISVHHFTKQDVTGLDKAGGHGVTRGKDNLIFIGGQHKIDIHDLKQGATIKGNFPTVDLVQQLVYCKKGNYVCTLENKPARHGGDHFYVRVYLNWDKETTDQPMKARIAGRVTPGSQSGLSVLEMVEIPTQRPVDFIACCQSTGNIAVASGMTISIFKYCLKTHDISKIKFVDFDEMLELDATFIIKEVAIAEDIIGLLSETEAHIFQVVINSALLKNGNSEIADEVASPVQRSTSRSKSRSRSKTRSSSKSPGRISESSMTPFRGKKVVLKESNIQLIRKADNYVNLSETKWTPTLSYGKPKSNTNNLYLLFPSLVGAAQCGIITEPGETFGPVSSSQCCNVRIKLLSGHGAAQRVSSGIFEGVTLIHRKIDHLTEPDLPFSNLYMNCIYNDFKENSTSPRNTTHPLLPQSNGKINQKTGISVFLTTPHTGHLYHISLTSNPMESSIVRGGVFSYTAPVDTVALEPCLLHALTLTGLETYTLRPHPQIIETVLPGDHDMIVPPHWEESVCLVGLRPFLNVESLTLTDSCLALIAANDEGGDKSHTTYSLHLPSAASLYREMIRVGMGHRAASPSTYVHLLLEAHIVLLTAIKCQRNQEDLRMIPEEEEDLVSLLQDSSALLGDYYASCDNAMEWQQAVQYYRASTLTPDAILERLTSNSPGLVYILTTIMLLPNTSPLSATQANFILDAFEHIAPEAVSKLVLKSTCLKEYKKEKVLNIIKQELSKTTEPNPTDVLALALIVQEKGTTEKVSSVLTLLRSHKLVEVLLQHSRLLVEREENQLKLSNLAQILLEQKNDIFNEVFVLLIGEGTFSLNAFVDAFISVYPVVSCEIECNTNSLRLRDLIENFFLEFGHLPELTEQSEKYERAINVLISLYVASLLGAFNSADEDENGKSEQRSVWTNLFGARPTFLNSFSPFHGKPPATTCKNKIEETEKTSPAEECNCQQCCVHLLLLQSLLNSDLPSTENKANILKVVTSHPEIKGSSSLHVLCLDPPQQVSYIIENHPNALVQFCKDTYQTPFEWEVVIKELIKRVNETSKEEHQYKTLDITLNELLNELVVTSTFQEFTDVMPREHHDQFRSHIRQCHSAGIANFLKETFVTYSDNVLKHSFAEA